MSLIKDKKTVCGKIHYERFDSAAEVVEACRVRPLTNESFHDMKTYLIRPKWHGVASYDEALELMRTGYQPTVEALRGATKIKVAGERKRFSFENSVQGFAPVVPLALMGVPNSMIDMRIRPIKTKVIDIYYDMTVNSGVRPEQILDNGNKILGAIIELEKQGYRFNLYAVQAFSDRWSADMMIVKVKDARQPLDLKRVSFPLAHTAFFRVIGFDWYSKVPGGKYRGAGYGNTMSSVQSAGKLTQMAKEMFGANAVYFTADNILWNGEDYIKEVLTNGNGKA